MRAIYEAYFRRREQSLGGRGFPWQDDLSLTISPPALAPLLRTIPSTWRSDARYFLARNIYEMVIAPYLYADGPSYADVDELEIWPLIKDDIRDISRVAEDLAADRKRDYVSATTVVMALGRLAPDLRTTSLQIWGPRTRGG